MTFHAFNVTEQQVNSVNAINAADALAAASTLSSPEELFENEMDRLERVSQAWVDDWSRLDPHVCHFKDLDALYASAPDEVARGMVLGIDMFRVQLEAVTGMPYRNDAHSRGQLPLQGTVQAPPLVSADDFAVEWDLLMDANPGWLDEWDAVDPFIAPYASVAGLLRSAPGPVWRGLLIGINSFRINLEAITGRPYKYEMGVQ